MKLNDIISNLKFLGIKNYHDTEIDSLSCDSHEKLNKGIYFCLKGTKQDGHNFAQESVDNGAVCLIVERYIELDEQQNVVQILVEDARSAMSYISAIFYGTNKSKMKFVGITGTNGKTTTTFILRDILRRLNKKVGLIGTEGIFINSLQLPAMLTTPDPIVLHKTIREMEDNGCEYCVMEVSAHAIALKKIDNINYDVVGLSNITKDHLDFFLNMDNYMKCKASLFDFKHAKCGVINTDVKYGKEIAKNSNIDIIKLGKTGDIKLNNITHKEGGSSFSFEYRGEEYSANTNLVGDYNIYNLLMATGCLIKLGYSVNDILRCINNTEFFVPGRFNLVNAPANYKIIIDYAHTPDGIKNIITSARGMPVGRIITVFGCGGNRDKTKRHEMGDIASQLSDYVVVTSDNPRYENPDMIIDDILDGNSAKNLIRITDRKAAINYALSYAKEGDMVLILGKGAENYQEINGVKHPYNDYDVVEEYFAMTNKDELKA